MPSLPTHSATTSKKPTSMTNAKQPLVPTSKQGLSRTEGTASHAAIDPTSTMHHSLISTARVKSCTQAKGTSESRTSKSSIEVIRPYAKTDRSTTPTDYTKRPTITPSKASQQVRTVLSTEGAGDRRRRERQARRQAGCTGGLRSPRRLDGHTKLSP